MTNPPAERRTTVHRRDVDDVTARRMRSALFAHGYGDMGMGKWERAVVVCGTDGRLEVKSRDECARKVRPLSTPIRTLDVPPGAVLALAMDAAGEPVLSLVYPGRSER